MSLVESELYSSRELLRTLRTAANRVLELTAGISACVQYRQGEPQLILHTHLPSPSGPPQDQHSTSARGHPPLPSLLTTRAGFDKSGPLFKRWSSMPPALRHTTTILTRASSTSLLTGNIVNLPSTTFHPPKQALISPRSSRPIRALHTTSPSQTKTHRTPPASTTTPTTSPPTTATQPTPEDAASVLESLTTAAWSTSPINTGNPYLFLPPDLAFTATASSPYTVHQIYAAQPLAQPAAQPLAPARRLGPDDEEEDLDDTLRGDDVDPTPTETFLSVAAGFPPFRLGASSASVVCGSVAASTSLASQPAGAEEEVAALAADMASDQDYAAFLDKAGADKAAGEKKGQEGGLRVETVKGVEVHPALRGVERHTYGSDADEPFEAVSLRAPGAHEGRKLGVEEFRELSGLGGGVEVKSMSVKEFDPKGKYKEVLGKVEEAVGGEGESSVFAAETGGARVEYWVVGVKEGGTVVGVRAKAVES